MTQTAIYSQLAEHAEQMAKLFRQLAGGELPFQSPTVQQTGSQVLCKCGEPAEFQRGHSEKTGKDWTRHVCAKPPSDPKNCGFKVWGK